VSEARSYWARSGLLVLFLCLVPLTALTAPVSLTVLHTNDTHGHLRPFSYPSVAPPGSDLEGVTALTDIGGIARRATMVRRIREELEKKGTAVWLVDAGDFSEGTPFSTEYHGEADLSAMNAAGYTFATLGNHEFNNPLAQLKKLLGVATFPFVCANAVEKSGIPLVKPYVIQTLGQVRIGVFGVLTREAATYPAAKEGISVGDEIETARRMVAELAPKVDIVMLVSHAGKEMDEKLAAAVPGIDVIVGGHSHSRLPIGEFVWRSEDLESDWVNGTVIVQAYQWGGELGRLDLLFDQDKQGKWRISRYRARLIPVVDTVPEDEKVAAVVDRFWKPIAGRYGEVLGRAVEDITDRGDDSAPYNFVADAVRETFGTEVEFENLGGVRAPLVRGDITRGDLIMMDPFNNTIVTFMITGRDIRRILLEHIPAVSGLRYRVENDELKEVTVRGQPLEDDRTYSGAANSYFASFALNGLSVHDTGRQRLDVLVEYTRKQQTIRPTYDNRRVIVESHRRVAGATDRRSGPAGDGAATTVQQRDRVDAQPEELRVRPCSSQSPCSTATRTRTGLMWF
jgi:5'-nucleotidase / UDP-sugar diphosphatase